jgi:hypothetical protein
MAYVSSCSATLFVSTNVKSCKVRGSTVVAKIAYCLRGRNFAFLVVFRCQPGVLLDLLYRQKMLLRASNSSLHAAADQEP